MKNLLNLIFPKKKSAQIAKERLQIIISHQRPDAQTQEDFLPKLRQELIAVISRYVHLDEDQIKIEMHRQDNQSMIEMNVVMPDLSKAKPKAAETEKPDTAEESSKTEKTEKEAETAE